MLFTIDSRFRVIIDRRVRLPLNNSRFDRTLVRGRVEKRFGVGGGREISTDGEKVGSLGAEGPRWERAEKRKGATASLFPRCKRWANS